MQLEATRIRNFGPFADFSVDLRDFEGKQLIAVCGDNGRGKTSLLELGFPGALYRDTPTQGSLADRAMDRKSILESRFVCTSGQRYTFRHIVDSVSGKSEAVILDESGAPVVSSAKVRDFDAWVERHLTAPSVLYSSVFGFQNGGGFLAAKPAERKAILLRVLGIEHLEGLAKQASDQATAADADLRLTLERLTEATEKAQVDAAWAEVEAAEAAVNASAAFLAKAESDLAVARELAADSALARARFVELTAQRGALASKVAAEQQTIVGLEERLKNNRAVLDNGDAIRSAVEETERLTAQMSVNAESVSEASRVVEKHAQNLAALEGSLATAEARLKRAKASAEGSGKVLELAALLSARQTEFDAAHAAHVSAVAHLESLQGATLEGADQRISTLRGALEGIVAEPERAKSIALVVLDADDQAVKDAAEHPEKLRVAKLAAAELSAALVVAQDAFRNSRTANDRLPEIEAAERELEAASEETKALRTEVEATRASAPAPGVLAGLREIRSTFEARLTELAPLVKRLPNLDQATTRIAELEPQVEASRSRATALKAELAALPEPVEPGAETDHAPLVAAVASAKAQQAQAMGAYGAAQERLAKAQEWAGKLPGLKADHETKRLELLDWKQLAADLGKNGLQSLEIDAAGPELQTLVNDLLHSCIGTRWTITIETTKLSADGKKVLDGCEVRVIDTETGQDKEGSQFSGGEKVLIGEALSLAFSMLQCRRSGLRNFTLVRDESGAALDAGKSRAYVAMLRRAATLIEAKHVLLVTHSEEVKALCDARIDVCPVSEKKVEFSYAA